MLSECILHGWPLMGAEVKKDLQSYWSFRGENVIICGIAMKGKTTIIQASLQGKVLNQLHINRMGIVKAMLLACEVI